MNLRFLICSSILGDGGKLYRHRDRIKFLTQDNIDTKLIIENPNNYYDFIKKTDDTKILSEIIDLLSKKVPSYLLKKYTSEW